MLANQSFVLASSTHEAFGFPDHHGLITNTKRKRRPAGTPDPDAEVVYLSPEMLMESDRYVCEICNQSFQREQNLQMHRRRHKVPWKLLKRDKQEVNKKRVYVCPEPSCLHHDPSHALGDLVGIKKHFRRKHSNQKQFVCDKCSKGYAVQSDFKAHLKICGTKGHSCDCGRVFSRVETFIEHQDTCKAQRITRPELQQASKPSLSTGFSGNLNFTTNPLPDSSMLHTKQHSDDRSNSTFHHNLDLRLELFSSNSSSTRNGRNITPFPSFTTSENNHGDEETEVQKYNDAWDSYGVNNDQEPSRVVSRLKKEASQLIRMAMEQKALAEKKRQEAKGLIELAKQDMTNARKIREQVHGQFNMTAHHALLQVTCHACNKVFRTVADEDNGKASMADHHVVNVSSSTYACYEHEIWCKRE